MSKKAQNTKEAENTMETERNQAVATPNIGQELLDAGINPETGLTAEQEANRPKIIDQTTSRGQHMVLKFHDQEMEFPSKSAAMLYMYDEGFSVSEIAKSLGAHYSFVYGVISNHREIIKKDTHSKSDQIREMAASGMTVGAIAKELNCNYSFAHTVVKKYKASQAAI